MKSTDSVTNGIKSGTRVSLDSTPPSGGITNVSRSDNSPVPMNTPEPKERGYRADQLVEMAGDDSYSLVGEAPRKTKMKG